MIFLQIVLVSIGLGLAFLVGREAVKSHPGQALKVSMAPILGAIVLAVTTFALAGAFGQVGAGQRGVMTRFGAVTGDVRGEGLYFIMPFVEKVEIMDVQVHAYKAPATAASKDLQDVATEITLNYRVNPERAAEVYRSLRRDYGDRIIVPSTQEAVKATTAHYNAEDLIVKRAEVRDNIESALKERLARHGIVLDQLSITNFHFSRDFGAAIEAKVVAVQNSLKAQNDLARVGFEAEQRIAQAKGEAEAIRIQAAAITAQGGENYVKLQAIAAWRAGGSQVPKVVSGGSMIPFIDKSIIE